MIERHFRVFLSSTFLDLKELRQQVIGALIEAGHCPVAMEHQPPSTDKLKGPASATGWIRFV